MAVFRALLPLFCLLLHTLPAGAQDKPPRRIPLPPVLEEVSGLTYQNSDSLWWHNDGGGAAALYRTNEAGELQEVAPLPSGLNRDWEDLTVDSLGHFFIGDFGNNGRKRNDLRIYRFQAATGAVDSILFQFPPGQLHDTEAFFWHRDSLHLFTKSRFGDKWLTTYHYVLPDTPGTYEAELRDSLSLRKRTVTGAAIDHETGEVVLVAYYYTKWLGFFPHSAANVYYFRDYPEGHYLQGEMVSKRISCIFATQYESVDFIDGRYILVASEKTVFINPKGKRVRRKKAP